MIDDIDKLIHDHEMDMDKCELVISFVPRVGWRLERKGAILHEAGMEEHACFYVQIYLDGYKEAEI